MLATAAAALLLPASASAAGGTRVAEFGMDVPGVGVRAASGSLVSPPLRAPRRYDLLGAEWSRGAASVSIRVRRLGGRWSRWTPLQPSEEPLRRGAAGHGTEPVWAGGDDLVQVRSSRPLHGLRLSFVNARVGPAARAARSMSVALPPAAGGGDLQIAPRSAWGASRCRPRRTATYGRVDFAIVHHTASLNGYSRAASPSVVLAICLFHRNVNGWDDIGYDFLVDRFGHVFEGRAGGIGEPVLGAQAGGFNSFSTGVAAIGDFRSRALGAAGMSALSRLLAWKLSLHGVPAKGKTTVPSGGGPFTPFARGTPVTVNRISGHRDVDSTSCPGNALYAQLPALRAAVSRLEGPVSRLVLSAPSPALVYPQALALSGRLAVAPGVALPAGSAVEIQDRLASGGRTLATLPLAPDGGFSGSLPLARSDVLQAAFAGGGGIPRLVSAPIAASVAPTITLQASTASVPVGGVVSLTGTVSPAKRRVVLVEQRRRGRRFRLVRRFRLRARGGAFAATVGLPRAGSFRFTARVPADRLTAAGGSPPVTVSAA